MSAATEAASTAAAAATAEPPTHDDVQIDPRTAPEGEADADRDHIERDVSNILAGLNQEQLASIVAAARASEARNPDADPDALPAAAASALTSIASGFKRTASTDDKLEDGASGKVLEDAIEAVKNATDTATAAAIASLGTLASASASSASQTQDVDDGMDADESLDEYSGAKRPRTSTYPELDRLRKDNHKEVERRRRTAINDGINQLSRIVPGCDAKNTNKGQILHAAVRYIQDLKHNEASNIEKWTLEKLLMDQAMGDLTAQLEDARAENERLRAELEERYAIEQQLQAGAAPGEQQEKS